MIFWQTSWSNIKDWIATNKNVTKPLAKTAATSVADAGIQKRILDSGTTTLMILNQEINYIIKTVQAFEDSNILLK